MNLPVFNFGEPILDFLSVYVERLPELVFALFIFVNLPELDFAARATMSGNEFKVAEAIVTKNGFAPAQPSYFRVAFYRVDHIIMAGSGDSSCEFGILTQF